MILDLQKNYELYKNYDDRLRGENYSGLDGLN